MQKKVNASILLWSVFLSLFICVVFVSISTKVGNLILQNSKIQEETESEKQKNILLKSSLETGEEAKIDLSIKNNKKFLTIDHNKEFFLTLKKTENFSLTASGSLILKISKNKNSFLMYSTGAKDNILNDYENIFLGTGKTLNIKNLSGIAKLKLDSDKNIKFPYKKYKLEQNIGNNILEKENGIISNN